MSSPTSVLNTNNILFTSNGTLDRVKMTAAADNILTLSGASSANVRITGVADPTAQSDAVTKNYIDNLVLGLSWKESVRCLATGNIAGTYDKSAGTITGSGMPTTSQFDGISLTAGNQIDPNTGELVSTRVLLNDQTDAKQNGIYYLKQANPYIFERTNDANTASELEGSAVFVREGTVNGDSAWVMSTDNIVALDATTPSDLSFVQFSHVGGNVDAAKIVSGTLNADRIPSLDAAKIGTGEFDALRIPSLNASKINAGTLDAAQIPSLNASKINAGTLDAAQIPSLNASKINAGTLGDAQIPALAASKITSGTFTATQIPDLDAVKITTGQLGDARIPNLNASKINAGSFDADRIPSLNASKVNAGVFDVARVPDLNASKINAGTLNEARIAANSLNGNKLINNSVTSTQLSTGAVGTLELTDAAVTGAKMAGDVSFTTTGTLTAASFTAQSDIRLKENVQGLKSPLEKVCNMEGYNYNFKSNPDVPRSGLIAQELEQVVPELVETDEKGMKSVNYIDVIPYLIESIKELKQMIEK